MKSINARNFLAVVLLQFFAAISIFAAENLEHVFQTKSGATQRAILTEENWQHIVVGCAKDGGYSGGHDFGHYKKNVLLADKNASVFFDMNMLAYIVSSTKGDGLAQIIGNLQAGRVASYHSLFPKEFITRDFTLRAFEKAYLEENVDVNKNLFFTELDGHKVAGFFERRHRGFFITSIFPDLSWYYRIDFRHNREETFAINRFLEWDREQNRWLRHGVLNAETREKLSPKIKALMPSRIINLTREFEIEMKPREFAIISTVRTKVMKEKINTTISVVDLFFANPDKPTEQEFNFFLSLLNDLIPDLKYKVAKKDDNLPTGQKLSRAKLFIKKKIGDQMLLIILMRGTEDKRMEIAKEMLGKKGNASGLHLGEELLFQMLLIDSDKNNLENYLGLVSEQSFNRRTTASNLVAKNFALRLLNNDATLAAKLLNEEIVFQMRLLGGKSYALELVVRSDEENDRDKKHMAIFFVVGDHSRPFEVSFVPITPKR